MLQGQHKKNIRKEIIASLNKSQSPEGMKLQPGFIMPFTTYEQQRRALPIITKFNRGCQMTETIIVALIAFAGTFGGSLFAHRRTTALIAYRLEQLENKVNKHNNLVERTYKLEERCEVFDEKMKVANHRIDDLEEPAINVRKIVKGEMQNV